MAGYQQVQVDRAKPSPASVVGAHLQRKCACGNHTQGGGECAGCTQKKTALQRNLVRDGDHAISSIVHGVLRSPGRPLEAQTRTFMEPRFGHDFSRVRIHDDARAAESARAVNAQAYTVGFDVVFAHGQFAPESPEGRQLIAHELAHVVQQDGAGCGAGGGIVIGESPSGEAEADTAAHAVTSGQTPTVAGLGVGLQRQTARATRGQGTGGPPARSSGNCVESIAGEDISSLFEAGGVTIVEFSAEWCGPCHMLLRGLEAICQRYRREQPPVPVRMYTVDVEAPGNEAIGRQWAPGSLPHLYIYVGNTQRAHYDQGLEPDVLEQAVAEEVTYAATPGAVRGAKSGAKWGALAGLGAGIIGAVAIGTSSGLQGNTLMAAILGSIVGGAAIGAGIGAGVGAIAGALTDDRKRGPSPQQRRRFQPKRRHGDDSDPLERAADAAALQVTRGASSAGPRSGLDAMAPTGRGGGQPLSTETRAFSELRFHHDFSQVRVHHDAEGARLAQAFDAYAVTSGSHIYFAHDSYAPATPRGRAILAHELAHVVQNHAAATATPVDVVEAEASRAAVLVDAGGRAEVRQGSAHPALALSRAKHVLASTGIWAGAGAAVGALVGLGAAAATHGPLGAGVGIGALIGLGVGSVVGLIAGLATRRTSLVGAQEAEALILRRYGRFLPGGAAAGPLSGASVHAVSQDELCERNHCRHPENPEHDCNLIGWTDTGPYAPFGVPQPLASQADEPVCNGRQLEHARPDHPVIYYVRDSPFAGTLIHEGLHAHMHTAFGSLLNYVVEGTTEYFTRRLLSDVNIAVYGGYDEETAAVTRLVDLVGEEVLARAYFGGDVDGLARATDAILGPCSLVSWAASLQMGSFREAEAIIQGRNQNHCLPAVAGRPAAPASPGVGEGHGA